MTVGVFTDVMRHSHTLAVMVCLCMYVSHDFTFRSSCRFTKKLPKRSHTPHTQFPLLLTPYVNMAESS